MSKGDAFTIDFMQLQIVERLTADVYFGQLGFEQDKVLSVAYEKNVLFRHASNEDNVYLYVYNGALAEGMLIIPSKRKTKSLKIKMPEQ